MIGFRRASMEKTYLAQISEKANKKKRKMFTAALIFFIVVGGVVAFALKDSMDMNDPSDKKLAGLFIGLAAFMLFTCIFGLIGSIKTATKGQCLILPFNDRTKEEAAAIIDREAAEGKLLVDEYISDFSDGGKPGGERVVLTPTYLLLDNGLGKLKAIPRDKICWHCAQVGIKGRSSFVVRLLVFTEDQQFYVDGTDVPYVEALSEKLYAHMPNIFPEADTFAFSHQMDALFNKDRKAFLKLCEEARSTETQSWTS